MHKIQMILTEHLCCIIFMWTISLSIPEVRFLNGKCFLRSGAPPSVCVVVCVSFSHIQSLESMQLSATGSVPASHLPLTVLEASVCISSLNTRNRLRKCLQTGSHVLLLLKYDVTALLAALGLGNMRTCLAFPTGSEQLQHSEKSILRISLVVATYIGQVGMIGFLTLKQNLSIWAELIFDVYDIMNSRPSFSVQSLQH